MGMPGSSQMMQQLVDEYYVALYRYAFRLSGCAADADDLTQEAFCTAQTKLGQLRSPECVKPWLFRILRNAFLQRLRAGRQEKCVSLDGLVDVPERLQAPESFPDIDPEQLQVALSELPELFRTPIILYYFEEFTYRDIAEQMELPIGTVMSRLARAKSYLRCRLVQPATPFSSNGRASRGGA
jgi:RNA polymerase sigma-70 factor, ECF subfamily